ncbi:beta-ketoacyl-ACP synthase 3 [Amycolatopsis sp. 195334CR]|uniref:beta-ketoacyl-ACP synthase 3 n=1 Tax=Amycolatopsis sp. 195334CR TaxID=2814588 RepID=UPI001F5CBFA4|nr:beta-ketoacyl-ACP synthase 3 [Amycolatopsis sp. 195334CR]
MPMLSPGGGGGAALLGFGGYRPRTVVGNAEMCTRIDSTEEWIESRCGIRERRFAAPDETLEWMAVAAAAKACGQSGVDPADLDCVLVASMSNLVQTPPLAAAVGAGIGARRAGGFDVSAACAGFCHALGLASAMVRLGEARHVLVVGAERMTDIVDPADRTIAFLFADGAGAAVVGPSATPGIGPAVRGADFGSREALRMTGPWAEPGAVPVMRMDGKRVFRWAVGSVLPACREALEVAGVRAEDLGAFVPHQANLRMIEIMADGLGLPERTAIARDVVTSGNTSAASVPLAVESLLASGAAESGSLALLAGFGAGLNHAAQVVVLP